MLAIHASKTDKYMQLSAQEPFLSALRNETCPRGCVLAVCELWKVERITSDNQPEEPERSFGDYTLGRYAWHLKNVRRFEAPLPAKGKQGLWEWTQGT